jgi:MFS family permease
MTMKARLLGQSAGGVTAILSFCLVANLTSLMTFPAVLPEVATAWRLSASEAGWIGGIYFAGYAAAVPFLMRMTDRIDGRWIVAGCSLLGGVASLVFAGWAHDCWAALVIRFAGGAALAGVHMPGLRLLAERLNGAAQQRGAGIYTSSYALGSSGSLLIAGVVDAAFGWRATFVAGAIGPLLALGAIACLRPAEQPLVAARGAVGWRDVLNDRAFMAYALGFAGNTWEVFGIRVWFVACLAWTLSLPGNELALPNLAIVSGLASLAGVPASIAVSEFATRWRRSHVIVATRGVGRSVPSACGDGGRRDCGSAGATGVVADHQLCRCGRARCWRGKAGRSFATRRSARGLRTRRLHDGLSWTRRDRRRLGWIRRR